jgi:hypothetical protein
MRGFWLFVHVLGIALWLGGGLATMVVGVAAKRFSPESRLATYRLTSAVQRLLIGPGAIGAVLSGVVLSAPFILKGGVVPGWLMLMMTAGILAALIALAVTVPTVTRLGRLDLDSNGDLPEGFPRLRRRLVVAASVTGGLVLIALAAGTILRT